MKCLSLLLGFGQTLLCFLNLKATFSLFSPQGREWLSDSIHPIDPRHEFARGQQTEPTAFIIHTHSHWQTLYLFEIKLYKVII